MEVLGAVAAVAGLLDIIARTAKLVQDCTSLSRFTDATKGLDVQLNLLRSVLLDIDKGWKAKSLSATEWGELNPVLKELREELELLNKLLAQAIAPNLLKRIKMSLFGFEKKLNDHMLRTEQIKSLLALKMTAGIHAGMPGMSSSIPFKRLSTLF